MKRISMLLAAAASFACISAAEAAPTGYHILRTVTLGGDGGWDYLNLDTATGNLYITRGSHVMVVDPAKGTVLGDIADLQGIHGTAFVKDRAYVTEGGANRLAVIDKKSLKKIGEIAVGERPDGIIYDEASGRIFSFNGKSNDATAVDPATGKSVGSVALGGKPEAASSDGTGTIFVNIEDKNELVAFDAKTLTVKSRHSLAPCESPSGQAIDTRHGRIFSVCDGGVMTVADTSTGKVVATAKIGDGPDASRFDPATGLIFSSNGESGTLTIVHQDSPDKYTVADTIQTASGARTMELNEKNHQVYLITADRKPGVPTAEEPHPRAVPVPGTFRLIVLGR